MITFKILHRNIYHPSMTVEEYGTAALILRMAGDRTTFKIKQEELQKVLRLGLSKYRRIKRGLIALGIWEVKTIRGRNGVITGHEIKFTERTY